LTIKSASEARISPLSVFACFGACLLDAAALLPRWLADPPSATKADGKFGFGFVADLDPKNRNDRFFTVGRCLPRLAMLRRTAAPDTICTVSTVGRLVCSATTTRNGMSAHPNTHTQPSTVQVIAPS
jgi:hypothetical protein